MPNIDFTRADCIKTAALAKHIAAEDSDTRKYLAGVNIERCGDILIAVATCGSVLMLTPLEAWPSDPLTHNVWLDKKIAKRLGSPKTTASFDTADLTLSFSDGSFLKLPSLAPPDGAYPDWRKALPTGGAAGGGIAQFDFSRISKLYAFQADLAKVFSAAGRNLFSCLTHHGERQGAEVNMLNGDERIAYGVIMPRKFEPPKVARPDWLI